MFLSMRNHRKFSCTRAGIEAACNLLKHFHEKHTENRITNFSAEEIDLYVISDPECRRRFQAIYLEFCEESQGPQKIQ